MQAWGEGFDLYAAVADALAGYWDGSTNSTGMTLVAGRFTGSQALQLTSATSGAWFKNSGSNDAVHHLVLAIRQTAALSGTTLGTYISLGDGGTAQCSVVFRSDGALLLTSGGPAGSVLATYTGAVSAQNTWFAFEVEVVVNNTTGSIAVRKNGNTSNDFSLGSLNTRGGTTNNYASRLTLGMQAAINAHQLDDLLWRSDASSVSFAGDIRCYTRMPASDVSTQFSRSSGTVYTQSLAAQTTSASVTNGTARYQQFTAAYSGTIGSVVVNLATGYTGNMKCALFASSGSAPTTVLGSATPLANPAAGNNTLTFSTPVSVTKGTSYYVGFISDTTSGTWNLGASAGNAALTGSGVTYVAFPGASPVTSTGQNQSVGSLNITTAYNYELVYEPQQDGATSYVYDSNVGDADFYAIAALSGTPASTVAVTTRGFFEKSDAGTRNAAVQLKSGATTVTSTSTALSTSFGWLYRTDLTDPNTSAAWSATAVNNIQIGPVVTL